MGVSPYNNNSRYIAFIKKSCEAFNFQRIYIKNNRGSSILCIFKYDFLYMNITYINILYM